MNSTKFCVHRDFGVANYEYYLDSENIQNSKWSELKKFQI